MTPTGRPLGTTDPSSLSLLDGTGAHVGGDPPTKERALHLAVYDARPSAAAVVHLHSTYAVAVSCLAELDPNEPLVPRTPYHVVRAYPAGVVPYARPGSKELAAAVRASARAFRVLLLANHGPVLAAPSLEEAVYAAEELEEACRLHLILYGHRTHALGRSEIADIRHHIRR